MSAVEQEPRATEDHILFDWRFEVLMRAGYLPDQAWKLATEKSVDVRLAERLLAQGCPRGTAVRILL